MEASTGKHLKVAEKSMTDQKLDISIHGKYSLWSGNQLSLKTSIIGRTLVSRYYLFSLYLSRSFSLSPFFLS